MAISLSTREAIELFHLLFLRFLAAGPDKLHYVVKGGCNLRFFFGSPRYSEDIDLDVAVTSKTTLKSKVDRLLAPGPFLNALRSSSIVVNRVSAPKQTDTTQRWKLTLTTPSIATPLHTKIKFSRRDHPVGFVFEAVDAALARKYKISAPLVTHYGRAEAIQQKIRALAHRTQTQARDIFDLHLLAAALGNDKIQIDAATRRDLPHAIENTMSISHDAFTGQVIAYLGLQEREVYGSLHAWNQMQSDVVEVLERLRS